MRLPVVPLWALILLLLASSALAIGVSPASGSISFSPNLEGEFDVLVLNSREIPINTTSGVRGPLAEYFTVTAPSVGARSGASATVSYAFPEDIPPGLHRHRIGFTESFFSPEQGMVARTSVSMIFDVWKPYPGQYAEIHLIPEHVPEGQNTDVEVRILSKGDQTVRGTVESTVRDRGGSVLEHIVWDDVEVGPDTSWKRFFHVNSNAWKPGKYSIDASFDYGSLVATSQNTLIIGTRDILISNLTDTYYKDVSVNRFELGLESMWNEPIPAVSATLQLGATTGGTPTVNLAPFAQKTLVGYWDTDRALSEGEHQALVTVTFPDGEPVQRAFTVHVFNESAREEAPEQLITLGLTDVLFIVLALIFGAYVLVQITRHRR